MDKDLLLRIIKELHDKMSHLELDTLYQEWLPKKSVMKFFDYGETQMRELEKENDLTVAKIRARKFYSVESIRKLLEKNKQ